MAIVVRLSDADDQWTCVNQVAHITVGTRDDSVKPKESNDLLARWLETGANNGGKIREVMFNNRDTIKGEVKPVLQK
jgi:tRNA ligase